MRSVQMTGRRVLFSQTQNRIQSRDREGAVPNSSRIRSAGWSPKRSKMELSNNENPLCVCLGLRDWPEWDETIQNHLLNRDCQGVALKTCFFSTLPGRERNWRFAPGQADEISFAAASLEHALFTP